TPRPLHVPRGSGAGAGHRSRAGGRPARAGRRGGPTLSTGRRGRIVGGGGPMAELVFWISALALAHTYFLYPLLLVAAGAVRGARSRGSACRRSASSSRPGTRRR